MLLLRRANIHCPALPRPEALASTRFSRSRSQRKFSTTTILGQSAVGNERDRSAYQWFLPFQTRWLDNDRYGHVNNAVYHGIFDSVINIFLIRRCGLDISMDRSQQIGFMVTNECQFFAPASYPQVYLIGLGLRKIGKTSLSYQLGMFAPTDPNAVLHVNMTHGYYAEELEYLVASKFEDQASCVGRSVHVFVDPSQGNKPTPVPEEWKPTLRKIEMSS